MGGRLDMQKGLIATFIVAIMFFAGFSVVFIIMIQQVQDGWEWVQLVFAMVGNLLLD